MPAPTETRLVFFDLDDTIYDRTTLRPEVILKNLGGRDFPIGAYGSLASRIAKLRAASGVFENLGFPSLWHRADSRVTIAALLLFFGTGSDLRRRLGVNSAWQSNAWKAVARAGNISPLGARASWQASLRGEIALREFLASTSILTEAREKLLACMEAEAAWEIEQAISQAQVWKSYEGFEESWERLERQGAYCAIASEGQESVQRAKLGFLRLGERFAGRLLTSERAGNPLDAAEFRGHVKTLVDGMIARPARGAARRGETLSRRAWKARWADFRRSLPPELLREYPFLWILDTYTWKSPAFFARALHAAVARPDAPGSGLDDLTRLQEKEWAAKGVKLVMVGDNLAKDFTPLQRLLGPGGASFCILRLGAHGARLTARQRPEAGFRSFSDWPELGRFLTSGLDWKAIPTIGRTPALFAAGKIPRGAIAEGIHSRFRIVSRLAELARDMPTEN